MFLELRISDEQRLLLSLYIHIILISFSHIYSKAPHRNHFIGVSDISSGLRGIGPEAVLMSLCTLGE